MSETNTRLEPFGGPQIAAVADLIRQQQKGPGSLEDDPIHPLGEDAKDALRATNETSQGIHHEPAD